MIVRKITGHDADERNGSAFFVVKLAINIKFLLKNLENTYILPNFAIG